MMGKVMKSGKSFKGCVAYCMNKQGAKVLFADGVRLAKANQATEDFNMQRKLNTRLGQAVGHIALAFSPKDASMLTDERMIIIAQQYLDRMRIADTQVLMVKHNDTNHPHVHIIYNRVNNQGKTISDSLLREKNVRVAKALTLEHGLFISAGKKEVNRQKLKGADLAKYQIYDAIKSNILRAHNMSELEHLLKKQGITMDYKYRRGTKEVQGINFIKGEYKFKGSEIDRNMSYAKLNQQFVGNQQKQPQQSLADQIREKLSNKTQTVRSPDHLPHPPVKQHTILEVLFEQPTIGSQHTPDDAALYRKKKKKGQEQGNHLSR